MRRLAPFVAALLAALPARADPPAVAADILPVHSLVARVMEGAGAPDLILPPGADPHGYAMRPSEAAALERADVVVWMGEALTPWLAGPVETLAGDAVVLELLDVEGTHLLEVADDHGHAEETHDDHTGHDHGPRDPHAWLDPVNARHWLPVIAEALAKSDPANAALYRANAAEAAAETEALVGAMEAALAPIAGETIAVYHDAYGYLEGRFGLEQPLALLSHEAEKPAPRRVARLRDEAAEAGIARVFLEPGAGRSLVETVFEARDVASCEIDPMGAAIPPGPRQYWQALRSLADTLGGCGIVSSAGN